MLNTLSLLITASLATAFAIPKIEIRQNSSPLRITNITYDGPTCNLGNAIVPITASDPGFGATGTMGFDNEKAYAKPEAGTLAYSDCTVTVDFTFPIGFHLNWVHAIAKGDVDFDNGMIQVVRLDVWFPSKNDITATNETRVQSAMGPVSQSFDLETWYDIPKSQGQDFWDACYGQSQVKIRIQQDATSTAWGTGRSYAYTKIEGLIVNLDEGSNGGKYTPFCGAELDGGGAIWSGAEAQAANMPKQCTNILCSFGIPSLPAGGVWSGLGLLGSSFQTGP